MLQIDSVVVARDFPTRAATNHVGLAWNNVSPKSLGFQGTFS